MQINKNRSIEIDRMIKKTEQEVLTIKKEIRAIERRRLTGEERLEIVKKNGLYLEYIEDQNKDICEAAIKNHACALQFVKKQTAELCNLAISRDATTLRFVNPEFRTPMLLRKAIEKVPGAILYLDESERSNSLIELAVQKNPWVLEYLQKHN